MKKIYFLSLFVFAILLSSCKDENVSLAGQYTLEVGETLSFNDRDLEVHFDRFFDTRCPEELICEDPGEYFVTFIIVEYEGEKELRSAVGTMTFFSKYGAYEFELLDLIPYPSLGNSPSSGAKTVSFNLIEI